jgi:prepilin-type N-terminal cleavage/methylation domain-containing protein
MEVKPMNKKGVTLIELIVVMVIIGILAAFFAPNIAAWLPNLRLRSTARDIVSTMRTAQIKAVSTNMRYRVRFTLPASYILEYENPPGTWVGEGVTQNFSSGISIAAINFNTGNNAEFNSNSTSSSGSLRLQNTRGTQRQLTLTPSTGRVTIQ